MVMDIEQQRRLADACLSHQDQNPAAAASDAIYQSGQLLLLGAPTHQRAASNIPDHSVILTWQFGHGSRSTPAGSYCP